MQVFLDGAFVASSSMDPIAPGEQFDLYLGVDERITVERTQLAEKVDVSVLPGLHGKMKTVDHAYLTTIDNHVGRPVTITLLDQVPVAQHDEIKIENVTWKPEPNAKDEDPEKPGVKRWTLQLADGAKSEVRLSFRVRHPVGFQVEGL